MSAPKNLKEFLKKFKTITERGWIKTHRTGPTGIGKTLEDLLGIIENNISGPDFGNYELKTMRTTTNSMITLFTKSPNPHKVNSILLETYGFTTANYKNQNKVLHTTLDAVKYSPLGNTGKALKIKCTEKRISIIDHEGNEPAYWDPDQLEKVFSKKYSHRLILAFADSMGSGKNEEFKFHTAWELFDFSFEGMINLLVEGQIKIDIRIGQYPNGKPHDHGTGFRIFERDLTKMFKTKNVLFSAN